ncbi:MAG: tRNA (guanine-N(1)-)-methyltransferase [Patescibacteria group bacterium]|nr:MAG: tRNA (guanine-N(1)-)-methyltransferase [Patescibacteria group bacterium]
MKISILTLFPEMFSGPFDASIIKKARERNLVDIRLINIRDFGIGKHHLVDDTPYGGGVGMVMRVDVLHKAIQKAKDPQIPEEKEKVILLTPDGTLYTQRVAESFAQFKHLILVCGHYEGIDERIKAFVDYEISIGDFILTGGEIPAMAITDSVVRLIPGVFKTGVTESESFSLRGEGGKILLEYPLYTKPAEYLGMKVPDILLGGDHAKIKEWRYEQALKKTRQKRPDLLQKGVNSAD